MSVFWSEAPRPEIQSGPLHEQANAAYRRQWKAVAEYIEAMRAGDDFGCYCNLRDDDPAEPCAECGTLVAPAEARVSCHSYGAVVCRACGAPEDGETP